MSKYHSSSHTTYNIGYHVVFSPKYRYRLLRGASAAMLKELLLEKASNLVCPKYFAESVGHISEKTVVKYIASQKSNTLSSPG